MNENQKTQKDPVERQYEQWVYPKPINCLDKPFCSNYLLRHYAYWPDRDSWGKIDVLIAGCGTNQAASFSYHNPSLRVVGIDVSASSIAHEKKLKREYKIDNLTLHKLAIEDVASLGCDYDLIFSHGVLHHLPDPVEGLNALRQVLRREGAMSIMLYGKYARPGVFFLQKLFRMLNLEQTREAVDMVKMVLQQLSAEHPAKSWVQISPDAKYDSGLVDAFLHPRNVAFSVDGCLNLLDKCGLQFQRWENNMPYYPDAFFPGIALCMKQLIR